MPIPYSDYRDLCVQLLNKLNLQKGARHLARRHASQVEWTTLISPHSNRANVVELVVTSAVEYANTLFEIHKGLIMKLDGLYGEEEGAIMEIDGCIFRFEVHECTAERPRRRRSKT